jgi:hypothetical protein
MLVNKNLVNSTVKDLVYCEEPTAKARAYIGMLVSILKYLLTFFATR